MTQDDIDFGFTAVDEDDLKGLTGTSTHTQEMSSQLETTGESVKLLEYKMDNLADRLGSMLDEVSIVKDYYENEKVIVSNKLQEVENLIMPLLNNLMKNKEKEYIYWPNREAIINQQIERITKITRAGS
jgi:phosphatidate phosphatase PAH1